MINLNTYLSGLPTSDPITVAWWIFINGGWIFAVLPALWAAWTSWLTSRKHQYEHNIRYVLLAIDVPKETEQSPRAVEQIFSSLAATYSKGTIYQRLWQGKHQESFSFEIVSLGGYIQFLIRTPADYRDLIESSIYAQYPDAEITEVEDYVDRVPLDFDTDAYDLWGTEFALTKKSAYPLRTYPDFEHTLSGDFKDPMAALLEILSRVNTDEDVWLQLLVTPCSDHWKAESAAEVKKIVEHKKHSGHGMIYWLFVELPLNTVCVIVEIAFAGIFEPNWCGNEYSGGKEVEIVRDITKLTPGEKAVVEGIEHKASKIGFHSKLRLVYWGKRETFLKGRGVSAVVGAIQQFTALNMNGFLPGKRVTTKAEYFLKQSRINRKQKSILKSYKIRSAHRGLGHGFILNTEELASLYHFPVVTVKAPLVKKTETKKSEPPTLLPTLGGYLKPMSGAQAVSETGGKGGPPSNLPFVD